MAMRDRVIRDEIHKDILVPARHATIIDTKAVSYTHLTLPTIYTV